MLAEADAPLNQATPPPVPNVYFVAPTRRLIGPMGTVRITKSEAIVLEALARGEEVYYEDLLTALYHGEMPKTAKTCTKVFISRLRASLLSVGVADVLKNVAGGGYYLTIPILVAQA